MNNPEQDFLDGGQNREIILRKSLYAIYKPYFVSLKWQRSNHSSNACSAWGENLNEAWNEAIMTYGRMKKAEEE